MTNIQGNFHKPEDRNDWVGAIVTVTGDEFSFDQPTPEQIDVDVVAHSLSLQCRFNGHVPSFYSVAEHSVRVSLWIEAQGGSLADQRKGLWHDGPEAFVGDMVRPMKLMQPLGAAYLEVEEKVAWAMSDVIGLDLVDLPAVVREADRAVFDWETRNIRTGHLAGWPWEFAREAFLRHHEGLFNESITRFWKPVSPPVGQ